MAIPQEIERKFLVLDDSWRGKSVARLIRQSYLTRKDGMSVRVRVVESQAFLTIKACRKGPVCAEFEYEIPLDHAEFLVETACEAPPIEKIRHSLTIDGSVWSVDEFLGANAGLVMAEIELNESRQAFTIPDWVGREVTNDKRYRNSRLFQKPYSQWGKTPAPKRPAPSPASRVVGA